MLKNTQLIKTNQIKKLAIGLLLFATHVLFSAYVFAGEINNEQIPFMSISSGAYKSELNESKRKHIISKHKVTLTPNQLSDKATSITREKILSHYKNKRQKNALKSATSSKSQSNGYNYYADFTIYSAASFLEDDLDGDGFYQSFSLIFDADIYSYSAKQWGEVYALLYLSKNGGPWVHYYTTDEFIINSESDADEYEVISTFLSGYSTDYYDVLIDLYQVGYNDIVASYSVDDDNALYALPLESADYDQVYVESYIDVVAVPNGGSSSILFFILLTIALIRIKNN